MNIKVYPSFWIVSALFGYAFLGSIPLALLFMAVAFVSILVHEFGHACMAKLYGMNPRIELYALGGLTIVPLQSLSLLKEFGFVLMGPIFGGSLAGITYALYLYWGTAPALAQDLLYLFYNLNVLWTLLNLLPVHPLDGGKLMAIICQWIGGAGGLRFSYLLSALFAALFGLLFFVYARGLEVMGALLLLFAFDSIRAFRHVKEEISEEDTAAVQEEIQKAGLEWMHGSQVLAVSILQEQLKKLSMKTEAFHTVLGQLVRYLILNKQPEKVYELLTPFMQNLAIDELELLQKACFQTKRYQETLQLGEKIFVEVHDKEVALLNAQAARQLEDTTRAERWQKAYEKTRDKE